MSKLRSSKNKNQYYRFGTKMQITWVLSAFWSQNWRSRFLTKSAQSIFSVVTNLAGIMHKSQDQESAKLLWMMQNWMVFLFFAISMPT